jgi:hypothetical protein
MGQFAILADGAGFRNAAVLRSTLDDTIRLYIIQNRIARRLIIEKSVELQPQLLEYSSNCDELFLASICDPDGLDGKCPEATD